MSFMSSLYSMSMSSMSSVYSMSSMSSRSVCLLELRIFLVNVKKILDLGDKRRTLSEPCLFIHPWWCFLHLWWHFFCCCWPKHVLMTGVGLWMDLFGDSFDAFLRSRRLIMHAWSLFQLKDSSFLMLALLAPIGRFLTPKPWKLSDSVLKLRVDC